MAIVLFAVFMTQVFFTEKCPDELLGLKKEYLRLRSVIKNNQVYLEQYKDSKSFVGRKIFEDCQKKSDTFANCLAKINSAVYSYWFMSKFK